MFFASPSPAPPRCHPPAVTAAAAACRNNSQTSPPSQCDDAAVPHNDEVQHRRKLSSDPLQIPFPSFPFCCGKCSTKETKEQVVTEITAFPSPPPAPSPAALPATVESQICTALMRLVQTAGQTDSRRGCQHLRSFSVAPRWMSTHHHHLLPGTSVAFQKR